MRAAPALVLVLLVTLSACGGGGDNGGSNTASPSPSDDTTVSISNESLGRMALPLDQFPPESRSFQAAANNGLLTLETAAKQAIDPDMRRAELQQFGWVSAYDASYSGPQPGAKPDGLFFVDSEVDLFGTASGASGMLAQNKLDLPQEVGKTSGKATLNDAKLFDVKIADEAGGANLTITVQRSDGSSQQYRQIGVVFRRGRLVGTITLAAFNTDDATMTRVDSLGQALAETLNVRMASILAAATPR